MLQATSAALASDDALHPVTTTYAHFVISDVRYAIETCYIHRVVEWQPVSSLEHVPGYVVGAITLSGTRIPIMDLLAPFERNAPTEKSKVLILRYAEDSIGLVIDSPGVTVLTGTARHERTVLNRRDSGTSLLAAVLVQNREQYILLDVPKIFEQTRAGMVAHYLDHCPSEAGMQTT